MPATTDTAPAIHRCTRCGTHFPSDSLGCPSCGRVAATQSARITLAITLFLILVGVVLTGYLVRLHRVTEMSLANRWFVRGGEAMQAHLPNVAANDYRTALSYDPANREYRLRLSQALLAGGHLTEARAHLRSLWDEEPSNGEVNLSLARLYVQRGDFNNAVRYYNNAINGIWDDEPRKKRIAVRFEVINYLMQQHNITQAQSQLMALMADGPREPTSQLLLGQLLLQVNEPEHALEVDEAILGKDHNNPQAWLQKGQALFAMNRYVEAEHALANAVEQSPKLSDARQQLELLREALRLDTSLHGLSRADRAKRAQESFDAAWNRLDACAKEQGMDLSVPENPPTNLAAPVSSSSVAASPASALRQLYNSGLEMRTQATENNLRADEDSLDATMQYVFEVERTTAPICPNMELRDQALLMLAQHEASK